MHTCKNNSNQEMDHLEQIVGDFFPYSHQKLGFDKPVTIIFQSDEDNSMKILGKTAYYNPDVFEVVLYVDGRHPKDIMRSLSHELVHHAQNCRGDFQKPCSTEPGYAQKDPHLRKMEREAYTKGNLIFRDYEDLIKTGKKEVDIDFSKSGEPKMSLKEWKNNEINSKLMKKWGLLKEDAAGLEAFASAEDEDETSGAPASDAADLDEKHDHPGESCEEAHPGASHEKFEAGLRGQGGGPGDEHYQFDKDEREAKLEEDSEGEETYHYGEDEGRDEKELRDLERKHATRAHIDALKRDMDYDEDHERRGEHGTHFRENVKYRDDDDPTGRPTRRYDNPIPVVGGDEDPADDPKHLDPSGKMRLDFERDPVDFKGWAGASRGFEGPEVPGFDEPEPTTWAQTPATVHTRRRGEEEHDAWKSRRHAAFAKQFKEGQISVREAKEITLRIIERVRKEGK